MESIDPQTQIKITQSTSQFVKNNKEYINSEGLDLMNSTKNNQPIINPTTGELNDEFSKGELTNNSINTAKKNTNNIKILVTIFIVFTLIIGALGTLIYIRKSHS